MPNPVKGEVYLLDLKGFTDKIRNKPFYELHKGFDLHVRYAGNNLFEWMQPRIPRNEMSNDHFYEHPSRITPFLLHKKPATALKSDEDFKLGSTYLYDIEKQWKDRAICKEFYEQYKNTDLHVKIQRANGELRFLWIKKHEGQWPTSFSTSNAYRYFVEVTEGPTPKRPNMQTISGTTNTLLFGKYKGQSYEEVAKKDRSYIDWAIKNKVIQIPSCWSFRTFLPIEETMKIPNNHLKLKKAAPIEDNWPDFNDFPAPKPLPKLQQPKETTMNKLVTTNKKAALIAAKIEAGKSAITTIKTMLKKSKVLPIMLRGYIDHPAADLLIANLLNEAMLKFSDNAKAHMLGTAAVEAAYVTTFESFNLQAMIAEFIETPSIKTLLDKIED